MRRLIISLFLVVLSTALYPQQELKEIKSYLYKDSPKAYVMALDWFNSVTSGEYEKARAQFMMGAAKLRMGESVEAYHNFTGSLSHLLNADTLDFYTEYSIYQNLASLSVNGGQPLQAVDLYDKAAFAADKYVENHPKVAEKYNEEYLANRMRFYKATAMYGAGRIVEAQKEYALIDETLKPGGEVKDLVTYALLHNEYGLNARDIEDYTEALYNFKAITENTEISNYYRGPAFHNMADVLKEMGKEDEALKVYDQAINTHQSKVMKFESLMDKGELLMDKGEHSKSIEAFEAALGLGISVEGDLDMINIHYFLEKVYEPINPAYSAQHGEKFQSLLQGFQSTQDELLKAEQKRVFSLGLAEAKHLKRIKEMEQQKLYRQLRVVALVAVILSVIISIAVGFLKARRIKGIAEV